MKRLLLGIMLGAACGAAAVAAVFGAPAAAQSGAGQPSSQEPGSDLTVRVTPEMVRYSNTRYALYFIGTAWSAAALLILLRTGTAARLRDFAERYGRNNLARAYIFWPLFSAIYGLLTLPVVLYAGYLLPRQYGLSHQKPLDWALDGAKSYAVSAVLGPPVLALLYWTLRRSPRRWWLGFWVASIPLLVLTILLGPLIIDPLFNRFRPLQDTELRDRLLRLAHQAGIEHSRVFEVDASRRTETVNAYVTGLGGSARIVIWDTLLKKLDREETEFVMAHEMAHYVEGHVPLLLAVSIAGSFVALWLTDRGARRLIACCGDRWQVRGLDDLASLPVLMLVLGLLNFLGSPAEAAFSRTIERRADDFALRLTGNGRAAATAFIKLSELNLSHPEPPKWIEWWMFTHPPLNQRIRHALAAGTDHTADPNDPTR